MTIAGHTFTNGVCACGRRWLDIRGYGQQEVGLPGIAHVGNLNLAEASQIIACRQAEDAALDKAMALATGRYIPEAAP